MKIISHNIPKTWQFISSIGVVAIVSAICFGMNTFIDYRIVACVLLFVVSIIAALFDIYPVLSAAVMSALIWDFFFIPPYYTFHIDSTEDAVLFLMYFFIALVNGVLTYKIRKYEKENVRRVEKANTIKLYNTMLNSLSHELRTPIATIIGAADNLLTNNENLTDNNRKDLVSEISKASFRLNRQVENLLNMSRLQSGILKPKADWCDVNETVYTAIRQLEQNAGAQRFAVKVSPEIPYFKLDEGMLEQILYNLLHNACLYTPANGMICVTASCVDDCLHITVEDEGPGFPENEIIFVFDKFYRLHNSKTGGTGLGLSIVKGFTEALGGHVTLVNVSGGARFTLDIPAETSYLNNLKNE